MNDDLLKAIADMEAVWKTAAKSCFSWTVGDDSEIEAMQYQSVRNPDSETVEIPFSRAHNDRKNLLLVLRTFYRAHHETQEGMDDFVTLVGVYCNDYIRWNLHQALPREKDFALSELFDDITDRKMQQYLRAIQKGIAMGYGVSTPFFLKATELFPSYSLPYLYLFLLRIATYGSTYPEDAKKGITKVYEAFSQKLGSKASFQKHLQKFFERDMFFYLHRMNAGLRDYCLGTSEVLKKHHRLDQNPLPYILFCNLDDHIKARFAEEMYRNLATLARVKKETGMGKHDVASYDEEDLPPERRNGVHQAKNAMQSIRAFIEKMHSMDDMSAGTMDEEDIERFMSAYLENKNVTILQETRGFFSIISSAMKGIVGAIQSILKDDLETFLKFRDEDDVEKRLSFLQIPYRMDCGNKNFSEIITALADRDCALREKEAAQRSKNQIVQEFTHTYKNLKATTLYDIAKTLLAKQSEEEKRLGRTLLLEYSNKKAMTKDVFMMQLRYERDTKRLLKSIRESCVAADCVENAKHIEDLVEQSLVTCLVNIFYDASRERDDMRLPFCHAFSSETRRAIYQAFDQEVMQDRLRALDLLRSHDLDIALDVSPEWAALAFLPDEYAAIFLKDILVELLVNTIKYGDLHQPIRFAFTAEDDKLLLSAANALPADTRTSGTCVGLSSIGDKLSVLWGDDLLAPVSHHRVTKDEKMFRVQMALPHAAFSKERGTAL